jgi:2-(1,2-epoxy-1,2-dihydrophenyl)acetyl-CoA isomerase
MDLTHVRLEHPVPGVARVVLARPKAYNALDLRTATELREALRNVEMDDAVRAVVLTGEGRAFCGGGDVAAFHDALPAPEQLIRDIVVPLHDAIAIMAHMDKPVLAAINGAVAGAGLGLALAADLACCARSAKLTLAYTGIGASPDGGTTFHLPRLVGLRRALELVLENRVLSADEALAWGLINEVVDDDALQAHVLDRAQKLAQGPTRAFGTAKRLLHGSFEESLEAQLGREARGIAAMASTDDFAEGVSAFTDKRRPTFRGR